MRPRCVDGWALEEAKEAAELIMNMRATLNATKAELAKVFAEMDTHAQNGESART